MEEYILGFGTAALIGLYGYVVIKSANKFLEEAAKKSQIRQETRQGLEKVLLRMLKEGGDTKDIKYNYINKYI